MKKKTECQCPFCQKEIFYNGLICQSCGIEFILCACGQLVAKNKEKCPECGREIKEKEKR